MTVSDFIAKWQPILTTWTGAAEDPQFAEDCWAVGFEMDGGESITALCPEKNWMRATVLRANLNLIVDVNILGSAIFSLWRYHTHGCGPLDNDTIEWFSIAFDRLRELSTTEK
jgi:hypothetical protein